MVQFRPQAREIIAKIVYYGPPLGGKTTNLQTIYRGYPSQTRGELVVVPTGGDRTIFFDFLPIDAGTLRGMTLRIQLYTVPGQVHFNATRQIVLRGVDGVVFVADSQPEMVESNRGSWENLKENLLLQGISLVDLPHVLQFNKRDLANLMTVEAMDELLNEYGAPSFEAVATDGRGVEETLQSAVRLVVRSLRDRFRSVLETGSLGIEDRRRTPAPAPRQERPGPNVVAFGGEPRAAVDRDEGAGDNGKTRPVEIGARGLPTAGPAPAPPASPPPSADRDGTPPAAPPGPDDGLGSAAADQTFDQPVFGEPEAPAPAVAADGASAPFGLGDDDGMPPAPAAEAGDAWGGHDSPFELDPVPMPDEAGAPAFAVESEDGGAAPAEASVPDGPEAAGPVTGDPAAAEAADALFTAPPADEPEPGVLDADEPAFAVPPAAVVVADDETFAAPDLDALDLGSEPFDLDALPAPGGIAPMPDSPAAPGDPFAGDDLPEAELGEDVFLAAPLPSPPAAEAAEEGAEEPDLGTAEGDDDGGDAAADEVPVPQEVGATVGVALEGAVQQAIVQRVRPQAIAQYGEVRELELEVAVPSEWVSGRRMTLQLRLTLVPEEVGHER